MQDYNKISRQVSEEIAQCLGLVTDESVSRVVRQIKAATTVYCAGVGRSGLAVKAFAMRLAHLGRQVHVVGEVTTPALQKNDLLLIGSGSGSTESLVQMAEKAAKLGVGIILFTIDPDSPLAKLAQEVVVISAPSPKASGGGRRKSLQPLGTLFEQSLFVLLDIVVMLLMHELDIDCSEMFKRHANLE